jgi:hypothetical protein
MTRSGEVRIWSLIRCCLRSISGASSGVSVCPGFSQGRSCSRPPGLQVVAGYKPFVGEIGSPRLFYCNWTFSIGGPSVGRQPCQRKDRHYGLAQPVNPFIKIAQYSFLVPRSATTAPSELATWRTVLAWTSSCNFANASAVGMAPKSPSSRSRTVTVPF